MEIRIDGLEEVEKGIADIVKTMPVSANKCLLGVARKFRTSARRRTPDSGIAHKAKLKKKYGIKTVVKNAENITVMCYNSAPHFHLVEKGHELIIKGANRGFVEGRHMFEKTVDEYEKIVPQELEAIINKELEKF